MRGLTGKHPLDRHSARAGSARHAEDRAAGLHSARRRSPRRAPANAARGDAGAPAQRRPSKLGLGAEALAKLGKRPRVHVPDGASYQSRTFGCRAGSRPYKVYLPSKMRGGQAPLIVMLHGCTQNADDFAVGTGMNSLAEEHGFIVAYPEQPVTADQLGCWNWFNRQHQDRDAGEPSIIAGLTRSLISEMAIDHARVFVAGLSAGGAMAEVMSVTYPDLYAAAGVHSGLAYGVATDRASAFVAMSGKSSTSRPASLAKDRVRTIIFHGASRHQSASDQCGTILAEARVGMLTVIWRRCGVGRRTGSTMIGRWSPTRAACRSWNIGR